MAEALHAAVAAGDHAAVAAHLQNVEAGDIDEPHRGWPPLMLAVQAGHADVVHILLEHKAYVNVVDDKMHTPLINASQLGRVDILKHLLQAGADADSASLTGWTPLICAAFGGHHEIAALLLERGADATATLDDGRTAAQVARDKGHADLVALLGPVEPPPRAPPSTTRQALLNAFALFDEDGDGELSVSEFRTLLRRPGSEGTAFLDEDDIKELIQDFDKDGSGQLSIEELSNALAANPWLVGESVCAEADENELLGMLGMTRDAIVGTSHLNADARGLMAKHAQPLALLLACDPKRRLKRLDVAHNQLGDDGLTTIARVAFGADACPKLYAFDASSNGMGDPGALALAMSLSQLPLMEVLSLRENRIGNEGVAALADACASHTKLDTLDLGLNNAIGDEGRAALARMIGDSGAEALRTIYLPRAQGVGDRALRAACEARGITLSGE